MKIKIILILTTLLLFAFIFQSYIFDIFKSPIEGCTDDVANNFESLATIDNGTCTYILALDEEILDNIKLFQNSVWSIDKYNILKAQINTYFRSQTSGENSTEHLSSIKSLDINYMEILNQTTKMVILNCFKYQKNFKDEVDVFYKKYKNENVEIKEAKISFNRYRELRLFRKKVKILISKEYNNNDFLSFQKQLIAFKKLDLYKVLINCENLNQIISNCFDDLYAFNDIRREYDAFEIKYINDEMSDFIGFSEKNKYARFNWYSDLVLKEDTRLKLRKIKRDEEAAAAKILAEEKANELKDSQKNN